MLLILFMWHNTKYLQWIFVSKVTFEVSDHHDNSSHVVHVWSNKNARVGKFLS